MQQSPPPPPLHPMIYVGLTPAGQKEVAAIKTLGTENWCRTAVIDVCQKVGIDPAILLSEGVNREYASWRYAICIWLKAKYGISLCAASRAVGRTHSSMIYGIGNFLHAVSIGQRLETNIAETLYAATGYKITPKNDLGIRPPSR